MKWSMGEATLVWALQGTRQGECKSFKAKHHEFLATWFSGKSKNLIKPLSKIFELSMPVDFFVTLLHQLLQELCALLSTAACPSRQPVTYAPCSNAIQHPAPAVLGID